jgi:uncharacterized protein YbjT (DUF2867 family)
VQSAAAAEARNRVFEVGGPEALRRDEIPKIFEKLFHRPGQLLTLPLEVLDSVRPLVGFIHPGLGLRLDTLRALFAHDSTCDPRPIQRTFGIELESLHHFLKRNLNLRG